MSNNAAIYIADPSMMGSQLFDKIDCIRSYDGLSQNSTATGVRFALDAGQVTMNFMPEHLVAQHLQGFAGFAEQTIKNRDRLIYVQARIRHIRLICGCVITPGYDAAGTIRDFLFRFTRAANGLLFIADTIYDYDGKVLS